MSRPFTNPIDRAKASDRLLDRLKRLEKERIALRGQSQREERTLTSLRHLELCEISARDPRRGRERPCERAVRIRGLRDWRPAQSHELSGEPPSCIHRDLLTENHACREL